MIGLISGDSGMPHRQIDDQQGAKWHVRGNSATSCKMEVSINGGTSVHHPFEIGIFP